MNNIPKHGFLRLSQIIGNKNSIPPQPPIIPVGKSTWWKGVKSGKFPPSIKLGPRITAWRVDDIMTYIENVGGQE